MKDIAEMIERAFRELNVTLNPNSRFAKQIDVYLDPKGRLPQVIEPDHVLFQTAVEAKRDLPQVAFALAQLLCACPKEEIQRRLRRLVLDNVLPQDSADQSPGRDAQVELFVAALCMRGHLDPVFDESPDLHCKVDGQSVGVAIKRIKVPPDAFDNRFRKCVSVAANQIVKSGLPGIIVSDISQSLNPTNWRIPLEVSDSQLHAIQTERALHFRNRFASRLLEWTEGKHVEGIILIDHIPRCHPVEAWRLELFGWSIELCLHNQRRRRQFKAFDNLFMKAIYDPGPFPPAIRWNDLDAKQPSITPVSAVHL